MKDSFPKLSPYAFVCSSLILMLAFTSALAQDGTASKDKEIYDQLKAFTLSGNAVPVTHFRVNILQSKKTSSWRSLTTPSDILPCSLVTILIRHSELRFIRLVLVRDFRRC